MAEEFERQMAQHCAPTLLGEKCASLVSLSREQFPQLEQLLGQYNHQWERWGLRMQILCHCRCRSLVYLYHPGKLQQSLACPQVQALLRQYGYPPGQTLSQMLLRLSRRLREHRDFPHEIGLFLGYPPEDVAAFIQTKGAGYKLCGYWKVYFHEEEARATFARYDACRARLCRRLAAGGNLTQLLAA